MITPFLKAAEPLTLDTPCIKAKTNLNTAFMKKIKLLLVFIIALSLSFASTAQDSAKTASDTLAALTKKVDSLEKNQDTLMAKMKAEADTAAMQSIRASEVFRKNPLPNYAHPYPEHKIVSWIAYLVLLGFLGMVIFFFLNSPLCRDESYDPEGKPKEIKKRPFSFSKVQLFWWTVLIIFCFIWFFAKYGVLLPFNQTVILLLTGGIVVRLFGKTIDNNQIRKNKVRSSEVNNNGRPLSTRHQDVHDSQGFLTDILSDEDGISIHRMQALVFNLIYGVAFIAFFFSALRVKQYPFMEFEDWQMALLGISSAGYLTLKTMENSQETKENRKQEAVENMNNFYADPERNNSNSGGNSGNGTSSGGLNSGNNEGNINH